MATKYQSTGRAMTLPAGVLLGAGMAFIWTIAMSAVMAKLIEMEVFPESAVGYGSMVILLTASALASTTAWRKVKHQRAIVCMCAGGVYFLILLAVTAVFFGGQFDAVGVTAAVVMAGSGSTVILGLRSPGVKKYRV